MQQKWFVDVKLTLDVLTICTVSSVAPKRTGRDLLNSENTTKLQQQQNSKKILADEKVAEKECTTEVYSGLRIRYCQRPMTCDD